ncbi:hypothetical protein [Kiloniella sp.]|uniref:hypothetical protein n=1 Tax=Kiloniella sp. TaxID=1938587 RepID=UPI003B01F00D
MQIEPRQYVAPWRIAFAPFAAVMVSLGLGSILILWVGASVSDAYLLLVKGAIGSTFAITETLTRSIPLI